MDILELLNTQLGGPVMERLGGALGIGPAQAQNIGAALLPAQVATLTQQASTEAGAQRLLDLAAQAPKGSVQYLLSSPEVLGQVRQSGAALLPQLLGSNMDDAVGQIAAQTGSNHAGVQGMMQMVLPLVLGVVGQQATRLGLNAGSLGSLFTGGPGRPGTAAGIGGAVAGLGSAAAAGLGNAADGLSKGASTLAAGSGGAASTPDAGVLGLGNAAAGAGANLSKGVGGAAAGLGAGAASLNAANLGAASGLGNILNAGKATVGAGAGQGGGVLHTNPALGGQRGLGWLWLLPLLLLVLLGGCFLLRGRPVAPFALTNPANASAVSGTFAVRGTGTAGHQVTVSENGQQVARTTVNADGTFSADVPAPSAGNHTYALAEAGSAEALNLSVTASAAALTPPAGAQPTAPVPAGKFALITPAAGAALAAGAFDLTGTGKPGDALEVFEDGVSLGKTTVGEGGKWTLNVASPAAGAHTYSVKGADGTELGSVQTTVAAASASTAACTKTFSLSMKDGESVEQPFRFGGVGSGKSYTVTVTRGERRIGSKVMPLDASCGYSYTSKPGKGAITYAVGQTGSADVASKITITVK